MEIFIMFAPINKWISLLFLIILVSCNDVNIYEHIEISKDDIPLYPNAINMKMEEDISAIEKYYWIFTTYDDPELVWNYYYNYFKSRWNISDTTRRDNGEYSIFVKSCPFYSLTLKTLEKDNQVHEITIIFQKEFCR
jgi:hypothetical protein